MAAGNNSVARGKKGNWFVLAEWEAVDGEYQPIAVKAAKIDGKKIKENTWYRLKKGKFVVVK